MEVLELGPALFMCRIPALVASLCGQNRVTQLDLTNSGYNQSEIDIKTSSARVCKQCSAPSIGMTNGGVASGWSLSQARPSLKVNQRLQSQLQPQTTTRTRDPENQTRSSPFHLQPALLTSEYPDRPSTAGLR